jgi:hypothetical protein
MMDNKLFKPGLSGLISFLDFLNRQDIEFDLKRDLSDAISVWFIVVGIKFEVDFFETHVTFNFYRGSEEVFRDEKYFLELLREGWDLKV